MIVPVPLFADAGDILSTLAAILVPIILVLRYLFAGQEADPNPRRQPRPQPQRRPQQLGQQRRPQGQVPAGAPDPADEVEAFLRRAAERRAGQAARDVEVLNPQQLAQQRRGTAGNRPASAPAVQTPVPIEAVETESPRESVADHVRHHMEAAPFRDFASRRSQIESSEKIAEAHVHQVFDHQLGSLGAGLGEGGSTGRPIELGDAVAGTPTAAAGFAAMLGSAQSLRNAIILQEVLRRPEEIWDREI